MESASETASLLKGIPILSELSDDVIARLAERCVRRSVGPGVALFTAGEECRGLYIIATGRVRVYRVSSEGQEQVLHLEGAGRAVAELPLFDGSPYPASAVTTAESRLVFLPRAEFEAVYRDNPDVAHAVILALAKRLRHLVHVAETLAFRDVAARLALLLAGYADRFGERSGSGVELALQRTRNELALEIGAARESVSRAFKQLHRRGLIEPLARDRIVIPDLDKLRTFAAPGSRARR